MKKKISQFLLIIAAIGIILIPILILNADNDNSNPIWDDYTETSILSAQEQIQEGNVTYKLETYMWRDFMPISPPNGKPLIVIIRVCAHNVDQFSGTINIQRLWIINGVEMKSTMATDEYRVYGSTFEMVFRNGPKWGPGIIIDVVVKLNLNHHLHYLKAENQEIHATF